MARSSSTLPPVEFNSFQLQGGLDLVTPPLQLKPGTARDCLNYEVSITGGYTRIAGYQRFDGRPAPNDAAINAVTLTAVAGIAPGDTISNGTGATGVVIALDGLTVYYTKAVSSFAIGDTITDGSAIGTVTATGSRASGIAAAQYQKLAADVYRADIQAVPGSGPVRGVAYYNGLKYAWRDSADGTHLVMYKSSTSGWVAITFGSEISYNTGVAAIPDGATITGGTSGATAHVLRNVLQSGTIGAGTAAGRLVINTITGTFISGELLKIGGATKATSTSVATPIVYSPGGRVQTCLANFGGAQDTKLYGADGTNRAFEYDDATAAFVPIATGMVTDTPVNVLVHKNSLFLTFGPSIQNSGLNTPYQWSVVVGAGEFVVDDDVTALQILPGNQSTGALGIYTASNTYILYGVSGSFQLSTFNTGLGAAKYTVDNLEQAYQLAEPGVVSMQTSLNYGNFDPDTITLPVRPFIQQHRGRASASGLNREKSQYRVFYNDGYALYITINNGRVLGSMPIYFPNPVTCWCEAPTTAGVPETSFFGSSNGFVYEMDTGPNCDGAMMDFSVRLAFNAIGNPRVLKRFRKAAVEVDGGAYMAFSVGYSLAYADPNAHDAPVPSGYSTSLGQPYWDAMTWDNFYWDGRSLSPIEVEMVGSAENVAMQIFGSSDIVQPFTVNTITLHYTPRRALR